MLSSRTRVLYVGVTNDLVRRLYRHRSAHRSTFVGRYKVDRLVWFESSDDAAIAIEWEKKIKGWRRARKVELIEADNPAWEDLSYRWELPARSFAPMNRDSG
ncbi:MAG: GIY-YIG nuclease family protein [Dehalococcoidia bacterium]|nr:GIY-YIG nuclease family protein [Dehalococcoidia bacterium]